MPAFRLGVALFLAATAAAPVRFASYLGGAGTDDCDGIAADRFGYLYLACHSDSPDFPGLPPKPAPTGRDSMDGAVVKLDPRTGKIVWATRIGGSAWDAVGDLAVASDGSVYALGSSRSADFPTTPDAVQRRFGGPDRDVILIRLDASGKVTYSTFLGSSKNDEASSLALGRDGWVYVAGVTFAADFPGIRRGELGPRGGPDGFLARLRPGDPKSLETVLIGGSGRDQVKSIAVDSTGNLFAAGYTSSPDFPVRDAIYPHFGGELDGFVAKFRGSDLSLVFSTYLGGAKIDGAGALALDRDGNPIVSGTTSSDDLPTTAGALQPHRRGPIDVFLTKLDRDGRRVLWSTYFGGSKENSDQFETGSLAVDASGRIWLSGMTASPDFPTRVAVQPKFGGGDFDGFLAAFSSDGARLCFSTFLGGAGHDILEGLASSSGRVYTSGITASRDIAISTPAAQTKFGGGPYDAVIFGVAPPPISACR